MGLIDYKISNYFYNSSIFLKKIFKNQSKK